MKCNHDCFHCKYPDCVCGYDRISTEIKDINNALFGWDFEIRKKRVTELLRRGYSEVWIKAAMNLTNGEFQACIKNAAKRLQSV